MEALRRWAVGDVSTVRVVGLDEGPWVRGVVNDRRTGEDVASLDLVDAGVGVALLELLEISRLCCLNLCGEMRFSCGGRGLGVRVPGRARLSSEGAFSCRRFKSPASGVTERESLDLDNRLDGRDDGFSLRLCTTSESALPTMPKELRVDFEGEGRTSTGGACTSDFPVWSAPGFFLRGV